MERQVRHPTPQDGHAPRRQDLDAEAAVARDAITVEEAWERAIAAKNAGKDLRVSYAERREMQKMSHRVYGQPYFEVRPDGTEWFMGVRISLEGR